MIANIRSWFTALRQREKILVTVAVALLAAVIAIYMITLPLLLAITSKQAEYLVALDRRASIEQRVDLIKKQGNAQAKTISKEPVQILVSQSAAEAGFTVDQITPRGDAVVEMFISKARSPALHKWLNDLEASDLVVEQLAVRSGTDGSVSFNATIRRGNY